MWMKCSPHRWKGNGARVREQSAIESRYRAKRRRSFGAGERWPPELGLEQYSRESMQLAPIQVEAYAGHKADETPRSFVLEGQRIEIAEVLDRWHQLESLPEWPRANYFKVRGANQREYL